MNWRIERSLISMTILIVLMVFASLIVLKKIGAVDIIKGVFDIGMTPIALGLIYCGINYITDNGEILWDSKSKIIIAILTFLVFIVAIQFSNNYYYIPIIGKITAIQLGAGLIWILSPFDFKYNKYIGWFYIQFICLLISFALGNTHLPGLI